jgi:hypothetical protein
LRTGLVFAAAAILLLVLCNTAAAQPYGTVQLTFYATDNLGYLEFLDLANQSGDIILTQGQSILLNTSQPYIILFVPYDSSTMFEEWNIQGDAAVSPGDYMTNITMYTNTILVAIASNPAVPTPEFPSGSLVMLLAFTLAIIVGSDNSRRLRLLTVQRLNFFSNSNQFTY